MRNISPRFPDEEYITYKVVADGGAAVYETFSKATELEKQRYLNFLRAKGSKEAGAPWLPTTKAPEKHLEDIK